MERQSRKERGVGEKTLKESAKMPYTELEKKTIAEDVQVMLVAKKEVADAVGTAVVDFQSPDIGEEFNIGHFRAATVANSINQLLQYCGFKVRLKNHIGAWSENFCMVLQHCIQEYKLQGRVPDEVFENHDQKLKDLLKRSAKSFHNNPESMKAPGALFWQYVLFNVFYIETWPLVSRLSRKEFQNIYRELGVILYKKEDHAYLYFHVIKDHLEDLKLITERKNDRHIFLIDEKGDMGNDISNFVKEGFNHILTDLAALWYEFKIVRAERVIYITTHQKRQEAHWANVVQLAKQIDMPLPKFSHVAVGLVSESDTFKDFKLADILAEAKSVFRAHLIRIGDLNGKAWHMDSLERLTEYFGCAAAKYVYLQDDRCGNDKSDFVRMLNDKKSNIYLMEYGSLCYTWKQFKLEGEIVLAEDLECDLGSHLVKFGEEVKRASTNLKPSLLCDYLYQLLQIFSSFSAHCKKLDILREKTWSPQKRRTILLCEAASSVMRQCFGLLGIEDPMELLRGEYAETQKRAYH